MSDGNLRLVHVTGVLMLAAGALLGAAPAAAQHVICCNLPIDVKGKWIGSGHNCAAELAKLSEKQRALACQQIEKARLVCPEVEPYCPVPCDREELERIKGRINGLGKAAIAHHKGLNESRLKRADARDRLWGRGEGLRFETGSIAEFGQAGLDSLMLTGGGATSVGKAYGKAKTAYDNVKGWSELGWGLGSGPADLEKWSELGTKLLDMEADAILRQRSSEAIQAMNRHFQKTGNYIGAQNVYRQRYGNYGALKDFKDKGGQVATGLSTLLELYKKTDKLANDLQAWIDAYRDHAAARREIEKIEAEIDRLTRLRQRLEKACEEKPKAGLFPEAPYPGYDLLLAYSAPTEGHFLRVAAKKGAQASADPGEATFRAAQQALGRLRAFQSSLRALDNGVGRQLFVPLSPWLARVSREAQPRELLLHLVKGSRAGIEQFGKALDQLIVSGEGAMKTVKSIPPDRGP